jgi:hypothetical protein
MGAVEHLEMAGGFADFDAGHRDMVSVTKFNFYGNRIVTASSDHRMKVWDLKDNQWQLTDTWRAHDAEIRDVRPEESRSSKRVVKYPLNYCSRQLGMDPSRANISVAWERT